MLVLFPIDQSANGTQLSSSCSRCGAEDDEIDDVEEEGLPRRPPRLKNGDCCRLWNGDVLSICKTLLPPW